MLLVLLSLCIPVIKGDAAPEAAGPSEESTEAAKEEEDKKK